MRTRLLVLGFLTLLGCFANGGDDVVLIVTASYPGASAHVVADTVAAPIEQQINGVEQMVRIESESRNDGSYVATVRFKPGTDVAMATVLVQNRIALAQPTLPALVARGGITVKNQAAEKESLATIAIVDRGQNGHDALRTLADGVVKQIADKGTLIKPETLPAPDEDQLRVQLDRNKCTAVGVAAVDVLKAINDIVEPMKAVNVDDQMAALKKASVKTANGEVRLGELATIEKQRGPTAVWRIDLYSAIRIRGKAPESATMAKAAKDAAAIAETERDRLGLKRIDVLNLSQR